MAEESDQSVNSCSQRDAERRKQGNCHKQPGHACHAVTIVDTVCYPGMVKQSAQSGKEVLNLLKDIFMK